MIESFTHYHTIEKCIETAIANSAVHYIQQPKCVQFNNKLESVGII